MNYYIRYNKRNEHDLPWEVWYGYEKISCHMSRFLADQVCDIRNEELKKRIAL